jgi:hypothetical protein
MTRTEQVYLRASEAEKEAVRLLAQAEGGLTEAALVRRLIRMEAQRRGLWPPKPEEPRRQEVTHAS